MEEGEAEVKFNLADDDEDWRCIDTNVIPFPLLISQREIGPRFHHSTTKNFENWREESFVHRAHSHLQCEIPPMSKTTYLLAFSPDGTKVASSHGDHNIYVTDVKSGKCVCTLKGHPRSPWCVAFHPSSNEIVASGCLGGEVRVWDLKGGSEVWSPDKKSLTDKKTVIASLAFHPTDQVLVIATENEIYFWNWFRPEPFAKISTTSKLEKVKYVEFDPLGYKLITGIAIIRRERHSLDPSHIGHNISSSSMNNNTTTTTTTSNTSTSTTANNNNNNEENLPSENGPLMRGSHSRAAHRIYRAFDRGFRNTFNQTSSGVDVSDNSSSNSNSENRVSPFSEIERMENENGYGLGPRPAITVNVGDLSVRRRNSQPQSTQSNTSNRLEEDAARIGELRPFPRPVSDDSASSSSLDSSSSVTSGVSGASNERNTRLSLLWTSRLNRTGGNESDNSAGGTYDLEERRGEGSVMRGGARTVDPIEERDTSIIEFPLTSRERQTLSRISGNDSEALGARENEEAEFPISNFILRNRERRLTSRVNENGINNYRGRNGSASEHDREELNDSVSESSRLTGGESRPTTLGTGNDSSSSHFMLRGMQSGSLAVGEQGENENDEENNESPLNRFRPGQGGRWMYYRGKFPGGAPSRNRSSASGSFSQRVSNGPLSSVSQGSSSSRNNSEDLLAVPGPSGLSGSSSINGQNSSLDPFLPDNPISSPRSQSSSRAQLDPHFGVHLLSRHIENMQSICRSLSIPRAQYELTTRQGNEISQLQQIRSMLYDIQHQIRSLRASVDQHILEEYFSLSDETLNSAAVNPEPLGNELRGSGRGMTDEVELEVNIGSDETDQFSYSTLAEEDPDQLPSNLNNTFESSSQARSNESSTLEPIPELETSTRSGTSATRISRATRSSSRTVRTPLTPRVRTRRNLRNRLVWTGLLRRMPSQRRSSRVRSHTSAASASSALSSSVATDTADVTRSSRRREIREARLDKRRSIINLRRSERRTHEESSSTLLSGLQPSTSTASGEQTDEMNIRRRHSGDWQRRLRSIVAMDQQREQDVVAGSSGTSRSGTNLSTNDINENLNNSSQSDPSSSGSFLDYIDAANRLARSVNSENGLGGPGTNQGDRNTTFSQNGRSSTSATGSSSLFNVNGSQSSQNSITNEFHPALEDSLSERATRTGPPTTSLSSRIATMLAQQREARHRTWSQINSELENPPSVRRDLRDRFTRRNRLLRRYPSLVSGGDLADATLAEISPELESEQNRRESYRQGRRESYRRMLQLMADRLNHMMNTSLSSYSLLREFDTEDEEGEVMEHQNLRHSFNQRRMGNQRGSNDYPSRRSLLNEHYNSPSLTLNRHMYSSLFDPYSPGLCNANNTLYRIQAWDFKNHDIPDISDNYSNIVVQRCRIHFDASVSISSDGTLLAAVLPDTKTITRIGVYSLETKTLGQLLFSSNIGFNIVCVSLSPTMKHLVVGISSHRLGIHHNDKQVIGRIYKLIKNKSASKRNFTGVLRFCKSIELQSEFRQSSLNCIRWIPNPGQGLVYGTNRGQLTIIR